MTSSATINVAIHGASGRMGQSLLQVLAEEPRFALNAAWVSPTSTVLGQSIDIIKGAARYTTLKSDQPAPAVVIDFSTPTALADLLDYCQDRHIPLVAGTTGMDTDMQARLADASKNIPILRAANFSVGIALLEKLLAQAASALADWDLEIIEAHHRHKQDAPSGTALALGEAAAHGRQIALEKNAVFSRHGHTGERQAGSIGFSAIRGGDVVGEHTATLFGAGERLELVHRATDRLIFARGAYQAAAWLSQQAPGMYSMHDVIAGIVA